MAEGRTPNSARRAGTQPSARFQDLRAQAVGDQIADRKRGEGAVGLEVGAEQYAGEPNAGIGERLLEPRRRKMDDRDRVADQRQRRAHTLECLRLVSDSEVAGLPARGRAQPR